jgi:hypothetical protein
MLGALSSSPPHDNKNPPDASLLLRCTSAGTRYTLAAVCCYLQLAVPLCYRNVCDALATSVRIAGRPAHGPESNNNTTADAPPSLTAA